MRSLTEKQKSVLDFIEEEIRLRRQPPTIKEVALHIGSENTRSGLTHIDALIRKGYIERSPGQARSLRLTGAGLALYQSQEGTRREIPLLIDRSQNPDLPDTVTVPPLLTQVPDFAVRVNEGRSILEEGICEGDLLFVQKTLTPSPKEIVVFRENTTGHLLPGLLLRRKGRLFLTAPSLGSAEKEVRKSQISTLIFGRVIALFRAFDLPDPPPVRSSLPKEI